MNKNGSYDLSCMSALDLVLMRAGLKVRNFPEDAEFIRAIDNELANRDKHHTTLRERVAMAMFASDPETDTAWEQAGEYAQGCYLKMADAALRAVQGGE